MLFFLSGWYVLVYHTWAAWSHQPCWVRLHWESCQAEEIMTWVIVYCHVLCVFVRSVQPTNVVVWGTIHQSIEKATLCLCFTSWCCLSTLIQFSNSRTLMSSQLLMLKLKILPMSFTLSTGMFLLYIGVMIIKWVGSKLDLWATVCFIPFKIPYQLLSTTKHYFNSVHAFGRDGILKAHTHNRHSLNWEAIPLCFWQKNWHVKIYHTTSNTQLRQNSHVTLAANNQKYLPEMKYRKCNFNILYWVYQ